MPGLKRATELQITIRSGRVQAKRGSRSAVICAADRGHTSFDDAYGTLVLFGSRERRARRLEHIDGRFVTVRRTLEWLGLQPTADSIRWWTPAPGEYAAVEMFHGMCQWWARITQVDDQQGIAYFEVIKRIGRQRESTTASYAPFESFLERQTPLAGNPRLNGVALDGARLYDALRIALGPISWRHRLESLGSYMSRRQIKSHPCAARPRIGKRGRTLIWVWIKELCDRRDLDFAALKAQCKSLDELLFVLGRMWRSPEAYL